MIGICKSGMLYYNLGQFGAKSGSCFSFSMILYILYENLLFSAVKFIFILLNFIMQRYIFLMGGSCGASCEMRNHLCRSCFPEGMICNPPREKDFSGCEAFCAAEEGQ